MSEEIFVKIVTKYEVKITRFRLSENWHVLTSYHMPGLGTQESLLSVGSFLIYFSCDHPCPGPVCLGYLTEKTFFIQGTYSLTQ